MMLMDSVVWEFDRAQWRQIASVMISRASSGKIIRLEHLMAMG